MTALLTLNSTDVATWKAAPSKKPEWLSKPDAAVDQQQLAGGIGAVLGDPLVGARTLGVSLLVRGTSESDMRTQVRAISLACYGRTVTIVQSINTARQITGLCTGIAENKVGPRDTMRSVELTLTFLCADPRWRTIAATTQTGISTTPTAIALGTAKVDDWMGTFRGASTNAFATLKTGAGVTLAVFGWTGSLAGGGSPETLIVDAKQWMTTKGGLFTPMNTWYGEYPTFDPADAPTIQISSGTLDLSFYQADWDY